MHGLLLERPSGQRDRDQRVRAARPLQDSDIGEPGMVHRENR